MTIINSTLSLLNAGAKADTDTWGELLRNISFAVVAPIALAYEAGRHAREIFDYLLSDAWFPIKRTAELCDDTLCGLSSHDMALLDADLDVLPFDGTEEVEIWDTSEWSSRIDALTVYAHEESNAGDPAAFDGISVKELRKMAKGLAKGIHLMRRDQLICLIEAA